MVFVFALTGFIFIGCLHSLWLNMFLKTITAWSHAFANNSHSGKSFFICWRGHKCKWDGVWGGGRFHLEIVFFFFFLGFEVENMFCFVIVTRIASFESIWFCSLSPRQPLTHGLYMKYGNILLNYFRRKMIDWALIQCMLWY